MLRYIRSKCGEGEEFDNECFEIVSISYPMINGKTCEMVKVKEHMIGVLANCFLTFDVEHDEYEIFWPE